eukprot:IDg3100t1
MRGIMQPFLSSTALGSALHNGVECSDPPHMAQTAQHFLQAFELLASRRHSKSAIKMRSHETRARAHLHIDQHENRWRDLALSQRCSPDEAQSVCALPHAHLFSASRSAPNRRSSSRQNERRRAATAMARGGESDTDRGHHLSCNAFAPPDACALPHFASDRASRCDARIRDIYSSAPVRTNCTDRGSARNDGTGARPAAAAPPPPPPLHPRAVHPSAQLLIKSCRGLAEQEQTALPTRWSARREL